MFHSKILIKLLLILFLFDITLSAKNLTDVSLQLAWKYQFQFAGYIMAKEKGFYNDVGLNVELKEHDIGITAYNIVSQRKAHFGIDHSDLLLKRLNNNINYIQLFALCQASPMQLQTIKRNNINKLSDLKGKKQLVFDERGLVASVSSMLSSVGLKQSDFKRVDSKSYGIKSLVDGTSDFSYGYSTITPYHLKKMGFEPISFHPKDFGFNFYGDILFTMDEYVNQNPKVVKSFYEASLKGWAYAFSHIDETIDIIKSKYDTQKLDRDILEFEAKEYKKLAFVPGVPFGEINPIKLEKIVNAYKLLGLTKSNKNNFDEFIYNPSSTKSFINLTHKEQKFIDDNLIFKVGFQKNNTPIEFINEEGLYSGITKDILEYISQNTGMRFIYIPLTSEQMKKEIQGNKIDFYISNTKNNTFINFTIEEMTEKTGSIKNIGLSFKTNNNTLQSILEKATKKLTINQKEAILRKWIPKLIEKPFDWRIIWGISSILGLIIIILLYKNIQQKKNEKKKLEFQVKEKTNELNISLDEKSLLLRELNHRVKNNMQIIISLLRLQSDRTEDKTLHDAIITIQNRINAMSKLHELLYKQDSTLSLDSYEYFEKLIDELNDSIDNDVDISLVVETELNIEQAIYCGLILNELVTNSLKYAFTHNKDKKINIHLKKQDNWITLTIQDNGKGYNQKTTKDSLGLTVVKRLADRQLDGNISIDSDNKVNTKITWIEDAEYKNINS